TGHRIDRGVERTARAAARRSRHREGVVALDQPGDQEPAVGPGHVGYAARIPAEERADGLRIRQVVVLGFRRIGFWSEPMEQLGPSVGLFARCSRWAP